MASKNLVNLDAMILREDFALQGSSPLPSFDSIHSISAQNFLPGNFIAPILRKPDFQRETNHWTPEQVVSLLECFISGDLIPSVILWRSSTYLFVIDGGHRLSVLRAWIEDDYGDGTTSKKFFGDEAIPKEQKLAAKKTRELISEKIGSWQQFQSLANSSQPSEDDLRKISTVNTRALPIQWVSGDAGKAETSFFKINTKGTPLDDIEELLLKNRKKPIAIASRAVIRYGMGHKYWAPFGNEIGNKIVELAKELHTTLFDPELNSPTKTLDLPLGGSKGVRAALQVLIEFILTANKNNLGKPSGIDEYDDDESGEMTVEVLTKAVKLAKRISGNDQGSLGLHPAIYFYGPSGRHVIPLFMGTSALIGQKLANNDQTFFNKFTSVRGRLEALLIADKQLIATILQKTISPKRVAQYANLLDKVISQLAEEKNVTDNDLVEYAGLVGKIFVGSGKTDSTSFSDDTKSATFICTALKSAIKCPICNGYLDAQKSISYDHIMAKRDGGLGTLDNCQLMHPYCNQSIKQ